MNHFVKLSLVVVALVALAGCGGGGASGTSTASVPSVFQGSYSGTYDAPDFGDAGTETLTPMK